MAKSTLRFAHQDTYTLALLAHVQRETGYVPTMHELSQLLQCPTTAAARERLDELVSAGEGAHLTPEELQKLNEIAEQARKPRTPYRQPIGQPCRRARGEDRPQLRWARAMKEGE